MKHVLVAFALALLAAAAAPAEDIPPTAFILHPAALSTPALKFALLPELRETIPGNAVDHYRQAIKNLKQDLPPGREWYKTYEPWLAAPLKDLPHDEVGKFLKQCESTFKEMDAGARSEDCDWGLAEELRKDGLAWRPRDLTPMREIAFLLAVRVRYEISVGRLDRAARTLQTGFAVTRHVADAPSLSYAAIGSAIGAMMEGRLEEFIQQPDAPNYYWPLTDLPRPFIDLHKPWQGDRMKVYADFPGMTEMAADLNAKPFTPEQVEALLKAFDASDPDADPDRRAANKAALARRLLERHEAAKKFLIDKGRPKELVDAMPPAQVGCMVALLQYDQALDECLKWQNLPFWEAQTAIANEEERQLKKADDKDGSAVPITQRYLRSTALVFAAFARIDRRIAALRCVEAVRLYAAVHDGKLPAALGDVKDVPIPDDPVTGKPFGYRRVGDRAFLSSTPFPDQPADNANTPTYELMFQR